MTKPPHILLVEDDSDIRETFTTFLRLDYEVTAVEHGLAAQQLLQKGLRPDLILLDLLMPVKDGRTFLKEKEFWQGIPVIAMSAGPADDVWAKFPLIRKPFDIEQLYTLIAQLI